MSERSKILENFEKSGGSEFSVTEIFFADPTHVLHQIVFASRLVYWLRRGWIRQTNHEWTIKNPRKFRKIRGSQNFQSLKFFSQIQRTCFIKSFLHQGWFIDSGAVEFVKPTMSERSKNSRKFRKIRGFRIFSHWNFFRRSNARASSNRFCFKVGLLTQARLNSSNQPWVNDQKS